MVILTSESGKTIAKFEEASRFFAAGIPHLAAIPDKLRYTTCTAILPGRRSLDDLGLASAQPRLARAD